MFFSAFRTTRSARALAAVFLAASGIAISHAADIQLSPDGPIKTPQAARDAARTAEKPAKIIVAAGTYEITEPITLGPEDSQVTWEAGKDAKPVISGGKRLTDWKLRPDGLWAADIPEVREGKWYFQQLWINGRRATRARHPNKGFFNMLSQASGEIFPSPKKDDPQWEQTLKYQAFITSPETLAELSKATPAELPDLTLIIPHTWDVHHYHVRELNATANAVLMHGPRIRELLTYEPDGRFYVENFRAALDAPGEWFLSRNGELLYHPMPGEDIAKVDAVAPVAEMLVKMNGAKDVTFRGLSFQHQQWLMGPDGHGVSQAANTIGAALELDFCENISFDQCEIAHTGGYALWYNLGCQRGLVQHCHIHDLGAGGVRMGPTSKGGAPENITNFITVDNCIIQHGGRIFPDAIGLFIGHSGDNRVTHNDIGDFYYSSISAGWHWGYGESAAQRNLIENNHLHHLGWGFTSDMGGFYNLGASFGTVVRGNHIHHITSYRYGGWGLYTDEGSSGVLMENNLVHDTSESCFHQHYGFYNTIRNNILTFGGKAQVQRTRNEGRLSFIFEKNILVWDPASKLLDGTKYNWEYNLTPQRGEPKVNYVMRNNLYWPLGGKMPEKIAENWTWDEWKKSGRDAGSLIADPKFESIEKRDFRLKPDSPALKVGFKPWDLTVAGVRRDGPQGKAWRELAEQGGNYPTWDADSKPWPSPEFSIPLETFEFRSLGSINLMRQTVNVEDKGDSIGVTEEAASPIPLPDVPKDAPSRRSLKLQDAPGLTQTYNPHYVLKPKFESGTLLLAFDIMAEKDAPWYLEMRDDKGSGYAVGPSFHWKDGMLRAGRNAKTDVMELPPGQWARLEARATLGTSKWNLTATRQDGKSIELKDLPCDAAWTLCGNILWSSLGTTKTALYLDNLRLKRE